MDMTAAFAQAGEEQTAGQSVVLHVEIESTPPRISVESSLVKSFRFTAASHKNSKLNATHLAKLQTMIDNLIKKIFGQVNPLSVDTRD